ncbi:hypothetical protein HU200_002044 [Digitaria exilis]|uniref:Transcription factor MYC/MYB N-terminal domain-containing protein n=1 Tax=Digitaria exilis TaxID=1010633 RepID=A0A835KZE7_9POAL|nr:hypothetical protein HU200_002044 [Digitaria exilis]
MEEQLGSLAVTHLLQHTLRSLCALDDAQQWVYAVFWRILPRNYPPPKWDLQGGIYDRTRGNRRNWYGPETASYILIPLSINFLWINSVLSVPDDLIDPLRGATELFPSRILAWEDGFCNFAASSAYDHEGAAAPAAAAAYTAECAAGGQEAATTTKQGGLQPELFFKMSHDIYNYGEGLIGKVAADHSHKWVFQEAQQEHEINLISSWSNPADSVAEDLSYVVLLRRKFGYVESIPGVLLPHPSSAAFPAASGAGYAAAVGGGPADATCGWPPPPPPPGLVAPPMELYDPYYAQAAAAAAAAQMHVVPSMSSLEALLSKLPSVDAGLAKEEEDTGAVGATLDVAAAAGRSGGESTSVAAAVATTSAATGSYYVDVAATKPSEGF